MVKLLQLHDGPLINLALITHINPPSEFGSLYTIHYGSVTIEVSSDRYYGDIRSDCWYPYDEFIEAWEDSLKFNGVYPC